MESNQINSIKSCLSTIRSNLDQIESLLSTPKPEPTPKPENKIKLHAWIYPGAPALDAPETYKKYKIDVLRPEYFRLLPTGVVQQINENPNDLGGTKNAFSTKNVQEIKLYSSEQLVTLSGDYLGLRGLDSAPDKIQTAVTVLNKFVVTHDLTGYDIDIEGFGQWTPKDYIVYLNFLKALGTELRKTRKKLSICAPNWTSPFDKTPLTCGWNWTHFIPLPIDYITPMMYDWQWDHGGGTPVAPLNWIGEWSERMIELFGVDRVVIGIPSYGYTGTRGKWDISILTLDQVKGADGYIGGKRDPASAEVFKDVNGKIYCSNDKVSLNAKRAMAESKGVKHISVWHIGGGNEWF